MVAVFNGNDIFGLDLLRLPARIAGTVILALFMVSCDAELKPSGLGIVAEKAVGSAAGDQSAVETVANSSQAAPGFDHSLFLTDCAKCHEATRPAPVASVVHGDGKSCELCHAYDPVKKWAALVASSTFNHIPAPTSCIGCHKADRPAPPHDATGDCVQCHTNPDWKVLAATAAFSHTPAPASCIGCHAAKRPPAPHDAAGDCVMCHTNPDWKVLAAGTPTFSHQPKPASCEGCHPRPDTTGNRAYPNQGPPDVFDPKDPTELGSGHYVGKDCVKCHGTPAEGNKVFQFTHSTPKPGVCLPCHFNAGVDKHGLNGKGDMVGFGNCTNCHSNFDRKTSRNWNTN